MIYFLFYLFLFLKKGGQVGVGRKLFFFGVTQNLKPGGIGFVCSDTVFSNFGIVDGVLVITDAR